MKREGSRTSRFCSMAIGTTGFVLIEGYSWFEGFYMTLITITTIGQR
jgi:hypothetical protein